MSGKKLDSVGIVTVSNLIKSERNWIYENRPTLEKLREYLEEKSGLSPIGLKLIRDLCDNHNIKWTSTYYKKSTKKVDVLINCVIQLYIDLGLKIPSELNELAPPEEGLTANS